MTYKFAIRTKFDNKCLYYHVWMVALRWLVPRTECQSCRRRIWPFDAGWCYSRFPVVCVSQFHAYYDLMFVTVSNLSTWKDQSHKSVITTNSTGNFCWNSKMKNKIKWNLYSTNIVRLYMSYNEMLFRQNVLTQSSLQYIKIGCSLYAVLNILCKQALSYYTQNRYLPSFQLRQISSFFIIIRPHHSTMYVDAAYSYWPSSVVCQSVTLVSPAKTSKPIEIPVGSRTRAG